MYASSQILTATDLTLMNKIIPFCSMEIRIKEANKISAASKSFPIACRYVQIP